MLSRYDRRQRYLLGILLTTLAFNYVDRIALGLLLQDIKVDLQLTDTQLGLLSGIAFALFYSTAGIPIARWADRGNRITIITITTALWSVAVTLCGMAGSFVQLILVRIGVAVGEAGCIPPAQSLIADRFSRSERPRAIGIYMLGVSVSSIVGFLLAGWLNELYGWRVTFMVLGVPGLILAALVWFTLDEPRVQASRKHAIAHPVAQAGLKRVFATLWANVTFRHLLFCYAVMFFFSYGITKWQPAFFIRSYGLETGELGMWLSAIWGGGGFLGSYLGGSLASRWAACNERLQLKVMGLVLCGFGTVSVLVYLAPNHYMAFGLLGVAAVGITAILGPLFATIQTLVPEQMRAIAIAIIYLFANLIGMGLGPVAVGVLSDGLRPWAGEDSLRFVLLALCPGYAWCAWHLWRASQTVIRDISLVHLENDSNSVERDGATGSGWSTSNAKSVP